MQTTLHPGQTPSPWPRRVALLLACATFPLIWVGGLVTTYDAGMAVPDWPTTYGYNMFLYPWQSWLAGPWDLFIEHGHRLFAAAVGLLTILLVAVLARREPRFSVRCLGVIALAAVIFQGILGGLRVRLDERSIAQLHACTAPAFFALTVALAVVTSRRWLQPAAATPGSTAAASTRLFRLACTATLVVYIQILLGSVLRHVPPDAQVHAFRIALWSHLAGALAVVVNVAWLALLVHQQPRQPALRRPARLILALLLLQLGLGLAAWVVNYGWPAWFSRFAWAQSMVVERLSPTQALLTTAHVAVGSLMLATLLALAMHAWRLTGPVAPRAAWTQREAAA